MNESCQDDDDSKSNPGEAAIVSVLVSQLLESGLKPEDLAVISPYAAQVQLINSITPQVICANSVDGFQGGEAEVVILSLVRSNSDGECGFLKDKRRLNVAISRARRCCVVIGDTETITQVGYIDDMITYICDKGNLIPLSSIQNQPEWSDATSKAGYIEIVESTVVAESLDPETIKKTEKINLSADTEPKVALEKNITQNQEHVEQKKEEEKEEENQTELEKEAKVKKDEAKPKKKSKMEKKIEKALNQKNEVVTVEKSFKTNNFGALPVENTPPKPSPSDVNMSTCTQCQKSLPTANMELHLIHCARMMRQKATEPVEYVQKKTTKKKQQKKNVKKNPQNRDFEGIDDIDDLLDQAIATAGNCAFGTCKEKVRVMGFTCPTCNKVKGCEGKMLRESLTT